MKKQIMIAFLMLINCTGFVQAVKLDNDFMINELFKDIRNNNFQQAEKRLNIMIKNNDNDINNIIEKKTGNTLYHRAIIDADSINNILPYLELFNDNGLNINKKNINDQTPLDLAQENPSRVNLGKIDKIIDFLIVNNQPIFSDENAVKIYSLITSTEKNEKKFIKDVEKYIAQLADIEERDGRRNEYTLLGWAAKKNRWNTARLLLENGAKIDAIGNDRKTPLYLIIENAVKTGDLSQNQTDLILLLLRHGADPKKDQYAYKLAAKSFKSVKNILDTFDTKTKKIK